MSAKARVELEHAWLRFLNFLHWLYGCPLRHDLHDGNGGGS